MPDLVDRLNRRAYVRDGRYAHLLPQDRELWERFIDKYPSRFSEVSYDLHVGSGVVTRSDLEPAIRSMAETLTKKRIDVVGFDNGGAVIIELKPDAALTAIGQVLCYEQLMKRDFPELGAPRLMIVTDRIFDDTKFLCDKFGIDLVAV